MTTAERRALGKLQAVVGAWYQASLGDPMKPDVAADFRTFFPAVGNGDPSRDIKAWGRHGDRRAWCAIAGYFSPLSVTTPGRDGAQPQTLWPLVTFQLRENAGAVQAMIRVVLCAADDAGRVDGWGWRFDSADGEDGENAHPYPHVQHITTWEPGSQGFRYPALGLFGEGESGEPIEHRKTTPETRPAVPLACSDVGGLAVAAMLSIYGSTRTAQMLRGVAQADAEFKSLCGQDKVDLLEKVSK